MRLSAGQSLSHYEILGPLGAGGMGEVYRARDKRLERDVAIKILPAGFAEDPERLARFEREAKALAALNHPGVAQVFEVDRDAEIYFMAMEHVPGEDLGRRLERGPLPMKEALELCARVADALEAAHDLGVVHRDLKPNNIVLTRQDHPKVLDFGLATRIERAGTSARPSPQSVHLTGSGIGLGTPGYMSPEQARGKSVDRRTDLFAFGCLLYECLTGTRAFGGASAAESIAALLEHEVDESRLPASTPARVRDLLARCLAKDPQYRQRGAGDAALELRAAVEGREWRHASSQRSRPAPDLAAAAAAGAGLTFLAMLGARDSNPAPTPPRSLRFELDLDPLTLGTGERMLNELAVSPDGAALLYVAEEGKSVGLYLHELETGSARRLDLGPNPRGAAFSQDSRSLAFVENYKHVAMAPLEGGGSRRMGNLAGIVGESCAWLEDGRIVLPCRDGKELIAFSTDASQPAVLAVSQDDLLGFENVSVVPDQDWFLADGWFGNTIDDYKVMAVDANSGEFHVLLEDASNPFAVGGRFLIYLRGSSLMAVRFDFAGRKALGEPRLAIEGVSVDEWGGSGQFAVSPEGTLVYAPGRRRSEGRRLVWASADGEVVPILADRDAFVEGAALSPDDQHMAVVTLRHQRELWSLDLSSGVLAPIETPGEPYSPVFSADGNSLYFVAIEHGRSSLRQAPVSGGASQLILEDSARPSSTTPDGETLILTRGSKSSIATGADLLVLELGRKDAVPKLLLGGAGDDYDARVSPDGRWLAYASDRSGTSRVYVRHMMSGQEYRVSDLGWEPRWAPDGLSLYYLSELALMQVELETPSSSPTLTVGERREVLNSLTFAEEGGYAIAADGRVAMIELADWELSGSRLKVVSGWIAELDALFESR